MLRRTRFGSIMRIAANYPSNQVSIAQGMVEGRNE